MSTILKALKHNFTVGDTSYTFNDSNITDNTIIDVYFTKDVSYECSQTGNTVTVEIPAQTSVVGCAIVINNVDSVDYPITAENVSYFDTSVYYELLEHKSELNGFTTAIGILDDTKQDTLTAGDNITIENNVISASGGGSSSWSNLGNLNTDVNVWVNIPDWSNNYNELCISAPYNYELGDTIIVKDNLGWCLTAYTGQNYHNSVIGQIDWQNGKIKLVDSWSVGFSPARTFNVKAR